ncbi:hypothetical protein [Synechococcus phage S-N03]|uniref:Uncharacterized protein n=1 Tax=Synechococcus phage S-N03 TaxID=2718943 RepID=A0A6G8R5X7_9CAUD|nr:hypothetical protein PQC09_gp170 [Synechococcus phage S-N03]QIN96805.1 hypothetical protein [Synechococcus phage S-N03]
MVTTNPQNVQEALQGLFHATMNLPAAADHCGMTQREMKMAFREFIKYHDLCYNNPDEQLELSL